MQNSSVETGLPSSTVKFVETLGENHQTQHARGRAKEPKQEKRSRHSPQRYGQSNNNISIFFPKVLNTYNQTLRS